MEDAMGKEPLPAGRYKREPLKELAMKDKIQQAICLVLWVLAIYLWTAYTFWHLFAFLFALHLTELLFKGWRVGREAGKSGFDTIIKNLLFGFTWWLPLERQLLHKKGEGNS